MSQVKFVLAHALYLILLDCFYSMSDENFMTQLDKKWEIKPPRPKFLMSFECKFITRIISFFMNKIKIRTLNHRNQKLGQNNDIAASFIFPIKNMNISYSKYFFVNKENKSINFSSCDQLRLFVKLNPPRYSSNKTLSTS
jgi:hypothetical protein